MDYHGLNEVMAPLSAAMLDMLELQYELESKAAKLYARTDIVNASFSKKITWNRLPQVSKHSPAISHNLIHCNWLRGPVHL